MNYLFFDIECATCREGQGRICEFGYVLTNESFEIVDSGEFLINPKSTFDWYALANILHFTKQEYKSKPTFDQVYSQIAQILNKENQLIFGQAVQNDVKFLFDESLRYSLPIIDVEFCDISLIYKKLNNLEEPRSLEKMTEELGLETPNQLHRAQDDSFSTMKVLKSITEKYQLSVPSLIKKGFAVFSRMNFEKATKKRQKRKSKSKKDKKGD